MKVTMLSIPQTEYHARKVFRLAIIGGFLFVPAFLGLCSIFLNEKMNAREVFAIFSVILLLFLILSTNGASASAARLRSNVKVPSSKDMVVVAPFVAKIQDKNAVALGVVYWRWQIMASFFSGGMFSWVACLFIYLTRS